MEYLLRTDRAAAVEGVIESPDADLHIPALCDIEVVCALRRGLLARRMTQGRAGQALEDYLDLPLLRHGHSSLLPRVLELRKNFSAYDATYVALAEMLGAQLITADDRLWRGAKAHSDVEVLPTGHP